MRWITGTLRAAATIIVAAVLLVGVAGSAFAADPPAPDVLYPNDRAKQEAYENGYNDGFYLGADDGYTEGLDTGFDRGLREGRQQGRDEAEDQADLRDEVAEEAAASQLDEGGEDLGAELTPSTPTPDSFDASAYDDPPEQSGGFPWWPLSFAVVATTWFVTRRRRLDAGQPEAEQLDAE